jgi:hypothetical protein
MATLFHDGGYTYVDPYGEALDTKTFSRWSTRSGTTKPSGSKDHERIVR